MSIKGKIMIVSSDKKVLQAVENLFQPLKYDLLAVKDLKKFLPAAEKELPDLVVVDVDNVEGDPFATIKKVKETVLAKMAAVVITTAQTDKHFVKLLKESRINDYIRKPVSYSLLFEKVKRLLLVEAAPDEMVFEDGQEFPFQGNLSQIPLPRILYYLKRDARTGILSLTRDAVKKVISFEAGDPKFVVSNIVQECLGRLLVAKGRLSEAECEESLKMMREWKKKQGETLIKMGLIEPYELDETLKMQARERLLEALGWQNGEYKFLSKKFLREDLTPLDLAIPQIVLMGIRRYYTLDILQRYIGKWLDFIPVFGERSLFQVEDFKLATWDAKTIRYFDGKKTFREIVNGRIVREIDVYHLIFAFYSLGMLKFKESETGKKRADETVVENLRKLRNLNSFQVLDADYSSSDEEIREKFESLLLRYSSLRSKVNDETGAVVDEAIECLKKAWKDTKDKGARLVYMKKLFLEEGVVTKESKEVIVPEEVISKGNEYVSKKDYSKAQMIFMNGIKLFPNVGQLYAYMGHLFFLMMGKDKDLAPQLLQDAKKFVKKGLALSPESAEPHLFYGKILKYMGEEEAAKKEFKRVVVMDPQNIEAVQELRVMSIREKKKSSSFIKWKK